MAIFIYNNIAGEMGGIDWDGFQFLCTIYELENIKDYVEKMTIIKSVVSNFDDIFESRVNPVGVQAINAMIEQKSGRVKKK